MRLDVLHQTGSSSSITNFFSASICAKLPSLCMFISISHPPTNSLSMYSCGIVGQSEYSLIPVPRWLATSALFVSREAVFWR